MKSIREASPSAALALVWFCFFVVALSVPLILIGRMNIDDSLGFANGAGSKLAWLVAPALGYFFAKPGEHA